MSLPRIARQRFPLSCLNHGNILRCSFSGIQYPTWFLVRISIVGIRRTMNSENCSCSVNQLTTAIKSSAVTIDIKKESVEN